MSLRPCPVCGASPQLLDIAPASIVVYYRCPSCAHVWNVSRHDPEGPMQDVTLPPRQAHRPEPTEIASPTELVKTEA